MAFGFLKNLWQKFAGKPVDWDELEESLIRADLGLPMTMRILEILRARGEDQTAESVLEVCREEIVKILPREAWSLRPLPTKPKVLLIVGVNGTGKTTSTAKLAALLKNAATACCSSPPTPSAPRQSSNSKSGAAASGSRS
jgi:fused signal recognition particle receptor